MVKRTLVTMVISVFVLAGCPKSPSSPKDEDAGGTPSSEDAGQDGGVCVVGDPPVQADCQPGCKRSCLAADVLGACQPTVACPVPAHAESSCLSGGKCGRGPCELEYYDFEPTIAGCETRCVNRVCSLWDGGALTLTNDPLHERSMAFHALSSGASFGSLTQRSDAGYQNVGTLGEVAVGTSSSDGGYTNYGGFMSVGRGSAAQRQ